MSADEEFIDDVSKEEEAKAYVRPPCAPAGKYLCRCIDVDCEQRPTTKGDPQWSLRFELVGRVAPGVGGKAVMQKADPEKVWQGRTCFDRLFFSTGAAGRRKLIYRAFGIDTSRPVRSSEALAKIHGGWVILDLEIEEFTSRSGEEREASKVKFAGYEAAPAPLVAQFVAAGLEPLLVRDREERDRRRGEEEGESVPQDGDVPF